MSGAPEVPIGSRDYWFKVVEFLQQNWALVDVIEGEAIVWFIGDTSGVFDEIAFPDPIAAEDALAKNGFQRYSADSSVAAFIRPPSPPFVRHAHPNGPIYSSGRFWKK